MSEITFGKTKIVTRQGDITLEAVDAIVNAANSGLWGGGGVDGAIHRAGGPAIMAECDAIRDRDGGCPTGSAVITTAGRLRAKHVIHTVGPIWNSNEAAECDRLLMSAYTSSIRLAVAHGLKSMAFPSISTGVYGFPIERAAGLVIRSIHNLLHTDEPPIDEIRFILFSASDLAVYERALAGL